MTRFSRASRAASCALLIVATGCQSQSEMRSNALEYLAASGTEAVPPGDVKLRLPVRVGVMFPPTGSASGTMQLGLQPARSMGYSRDVIPEYQKQALLTQLVNAFKGREGIASVQVIPSTYLSPRGGLPELQRVGNTFGFDLVVLVSYDQFQFTESGRASLAYATIVGAYFIEGEKNDTQTLMDATVFDLASRSLLFHSNGQSAVKASSTPLEISSSMREQSAAGFDAAMKDLIAHLDVAVAEFAVQVKSGTVRGAGTPKIELTASNDTPGGGSSGGRGAGALGSAELAVAGLLALLGGRRRRSSREVATVATG